MQVEFQRVHGSRSYNVMVVTPEEDELTMPHAPGRARALQGHLAWLAQDHDAAVEAVVLRSRPSPSVARGRRVMADEALQDAGYRVCRVAVDTWSPLLAQELLAVIRIELRVWELAALRAGTWRLRQELERQAMTRDSVAVAQAISARRCLNEALGFWGVGLRAAQEEWLPRHLEALEQRRFERSRAVTEPLPLPHRGP